MSLENALNFARKVESDGGLGARLAAIVKERVNAAAAAAFASLGHEEGFDFTPEEAAEAYRQTRQSQTMQEGDLDKVVGGAYEAPFASTVPPPIIDTERSLPGTGFNISQTDSNPAPLR